MESISTKPYHYRIVECLGEGLNSCVYRAFKESKELRVRFEVALKILKSENLEALWRNEFERLVRVKSRHCVVLHGWEIVNKSPALVLEYVRGVNLAELVKVVELDQNNIDCIYAQARRGLTDLSQAGLFHGDLNLNNIMVDETGVVKLVDFGVRNGQKDYFVTPKYAAPSVLMGAEPSFETDIFSLEAICAELEKLQGKIFDNEESWQLQERSNEIEGRWIVDLAKKVRVAMQKREIKRTRTNVFKLTRQFRLSYTPWLQNVGICVFCLFVSLLSRGDSFRDRPLAPAQLIVRTVNWLKISINGQTLGYAPVDESLSSIRPIHLHWLGPNGSGDRTLTLQPGKTEILTDKFFRPDSK